MKYTNYGKVNAIAKLKNFSIDKPVETVNNAIVCNANKTNRMLNINELFEMLSKVTNGNMKCKLYTDSSKYVGIGDKRKNLFSVNALKTKYNVYINDSVVDYIPKSITVVKNGNSVDKTRPHAIEIKNTSDLITCVNSIMKMFK